jgi:N-succinyldiaminopimelate aminotransferase
MINPRIHSMRVYPTDRKRTLFQGLERSVIADLTIGEPQHSPDPKVLDILAEYAHEGVRRYPRTKQELFLTEAIVRSNVETKEIFPEIREEQVLAGCGSGELLFSFALACLNPEKPYVLIPNPAYQVYRIATEFAGGVPYFFNLLPENGFQPDFTTIPEDVLAKTSLCYVNNPNNPCAVSYSPSTLLQLVRTARRYGFAIASDECYLEIYDTQRPTSILEICAKEDGGNEFSHVVAFDTLSKRSSLPGLRSGTMIGDAHLVSSYLKLRLSERKVLPLHVQRASAYAWENLGDVAKNRALYREKGRALADVFTSFGLPLAPPESTFYAWLDVRRSTLSDEALALAIAQATGVLTFPGSYFSIEAHDTNPGQGFIRLALIDSLESTHVALAAVASFLNTHFSCDEGGQR